MDGSTLGDAIALIVLLGIFLVFAFVMWRL